MFAPFAALLRCSIRPPRRVGYVLAVLIGLLAAPALVSGGARDHDRARAAVEAGEVLPLPTLLERVQSSHPGQVLELELEREHGRWTYEIKLLQAGGQLLKLDVDAASGEVLKVRRKHSDRAGGARDSAP
ncbi:MAG: PepSY domain-containing protein [Proteobacteria bacterium]|nr:PepSY domain-containing protein [Pseudomonadota bacterium]